MTSPKKGFLRLESIKQPQNVKVLILSQNKTTLKQFYFIKTYTNLIKIDLSYNKLASFPSGFTFGSFSHLRTLFLHYNKFSTLKNLVPVVESKSIYYLTLFGNPLEEAKARHLCVNEMTRLMLMDDKVVNIQERSQSIDFLERQNKILSFPLLADHHPKEETTEQYLENVIKQLVIVRRNYLQVNPLIKIQRWWKHQLRFRGRKWKIVSLPSQERMHSMMSNLQKSRTELDRLVTEKMLIARSSQEIVYSILIKNFQFWAALKQVLSKGQLYLSRQYCDLNAIDYKQIESFKVLRHFGTVKTSSLRSKKLMSFFLHYHHRIVIKKIPKNQEQLKKLDKYKLKSTGKNIEMNPQKLQRMNQKLKNLQAKYHYYVQPKMSFDTLFATLKKEYFIYQKALVLNFQPDPFPFLSQELVRRTIAAVSIQRYWRGATVRRLLDARVKIRQEKAAIVLQRWVRNLKFQHRYKFLLEVNEYLKQQRKSNEIVLQLGQIPAIQKYCTYKQQSGHNFVICFQRNSFSITKHTSISYYNSFNRTKIIFFAERRPDPEYLTLTLTTDTSKIATAGLPQHQSIVLQILFKNSKSIEKITDSKGIKFLKFTYQSVEQTLNRKFILALKTYRMPNHQFIKSQQCPIVPAQYSHNLIDLINETKLISMIDADTKFLKEGSSAHSMNLLQNQRSVASLNSGINIVDEVIFMKIRFFVGKVDYSCQLVIKSPDYGQKKVPKDTSLNSIREGYYYSRKKSISKRYEEQYTQQISKISRKIISLNKDQSQPNTSRKNSVVYPKILNTDQSHSFIQSLSPKNSYSRLPEHFEVYDKFDKQVYPPKTQYLRESLRYKRHLDQIDIMRQKRSIIEDIKSSHKDKILEIAGKREEQLNTLKQMKNKEQIQYSLQISKLKEEMEKEKAKKKDRIKKRMNSRTDSFESDFMKKGIRSINKEMREFEKKSRSNRQYKVLEGRLERDSIKQQHRQVQKTEIKEFSINFSENQFSLKMTEHEKDIEKLELEKQLLGNSKHLKSNISQEKRQDSEEREQSKHLKSETIEMKSAFQQRKKLKKKKMVHSVFPQQFYPLKQSKQLGFQLPRLSKN